jgi:hypothetical protein
MVFAHPSTAPLVHAKDVVLDGWVPLGSAYDTRAYLTVLHTNLALLTTHPFPHPTLPSHCLLALESGLTEHPRLWKVQA